MNKNTTLINITLLGVILNIQMRSNEVTCFQYLVVIFILTKKSMLSNNNLQELYFIINLHVRTYI